MDGVRFLGNRSLEVAAYPDPSAGPGEVVVRMKTAAICGSDLHGYRAAGVWPAIPGHEPCGVVAETGPGTTRFQEGDRVIIYHIHGCGFCGSCRKGYPMYCKEKQAYGKDRHGSDADFVVAAERDVFPLPDDMTFEEGAFLACNAGTAYQSALELNLTAEDTVVIHGLGPVGQCGIVVAKAMGARVIGVDLEAERRRLAEVVGADEVLDGARMDVVKTVKALTDGDGAHVAFDFTGVPQARQNALDSVRPFGRVGLIGVPWSPEISYRGHGYIKVTANWIFPSTAYEEIVAFFRRNRLPLDKIVSDRFPLSEAERAFEVYDRHRTVGKVLFEWP